MTSPGNFPAKQADRVRRALAPLRVLLRYRDELRNLATRAIRVARREGFAGVERRIAALRSGELPPDTGQIAKPASEFIGALSFVGDRLLGVRAWWMAGRRRRALSRRFVDALRGRTGDKAHRDRFRIHLDRPMMLVAVADRPFAVEGWAVDLATNAAANVRIRVGRVIDRPGKVLRTDVRRDDLPFERFPFDIGFSSALALKVGLHLVRVEVETAPQRWSTMQRHLVLRVPFRLNRAPRTYHDLVELQQQRLVAERPEILRHIEIMPERPAFTVIVDARRGRHRIDDTMRSLAGQHYPVGDVVVLRDASQAALPALPADARTVETIGPNDIAGDFVIVIDAGSRLAADAIYEFASAINQDPDIDIIYGDEDSVSSSGERRDPFYKPDWSPDTLETFNYVGLAACCRRSLACDGLSEFSAYDLTLRATEQTARIRHIAKILGHRGETSPASAADAARDIAALQGRLARTGRKGTVATHPLHAGCFDIRLDLTRRPLVSIVIPTAGKTIALDAREIDLIVNLTEQIRTRSTYDNVEIVVVDNGDLSPVQAAALRETNCKSVTYRDAVFNISRKLNLGAAAASGELLVLMNDDIEITSPPWLERLIEQFEKPHVGVVGARLLYPDGRLQHAGVVHNYGNPDHVRRFFPGDDAGYFFSSCGVRNYAAVTGACMATPASLYRELGGYDETFAVSFNDVDYCLRARERGRSIVYAPQAELIHMESQSRIAVADWDEVTLYHRRWAQAVVPDPFYNERHLSVAPPSFIPTINPRML